MDTNEVTNTLRKIIAEAAEIEPEAVTMDAHFIKELDLDSMLLLEIAAKVEKTFKVKLEERDLKELTSLRQSITVAQKYMAQRGS
ncbi:MAG: acyl carrier protein [Myxococcales bacterium]|nr:acyl carrier protein [Myxococcales bacterium]